MVEKDGSIARFLTHFARDSVAEVREARDRDSQVYVIGRSSEYIIPNDKLQLIDPAKTGKGYSRKICNICHVIKPQNAFEPNQQDSKGKTTTRPSCRICRRDIDKKPMTAAAIKKAGKLKPRKGTLWKCPICQKQCIVGVTARVVLDHRHSDGTSRAFLCDSCNTGLGRFKNGENYLQNAIAYIKAFENDK